MRLFTSAFLCFGMIASSAMADHVPAREASKKIGKAVDAISALAQSGVEEFKVKPKSTVKAMLFELALKTGYVSDESEFSWVGSSADAWEADSTNWGETTMKDAYSYIMDLEEYDRDELDQPGNEKKKEKFESKVRNVKKAFELFMHTGVQFGIAPMGAVQCGVTFAALAIIDPHTGKIYVFKREGSGC